jgi:Beta-galactosidase/Beta-galactosidase trimerisation domain
MPRTPKDDFHVLMWNFYDPMYTGGPEKAALAIKRFREMHCNGGTLIATFVDPESYDKSLVNFNLPKATFDRPKHGAFPFKENGFPFYVMNICRPFYMDWSDGKPLFRKWYESFAAGRDNKVFSRVPCVNDPAVCQGMNDYTDAVMNGLEGVRDLSLLYDLRDEPSITSFLLAADSCFCPHCMKKMGQWLKDDYGSLEALNAQWGTDFKSWDQVEPLTTQEAYERRQAGNWNFAPWHDHRTFMNDSFINACVKQNELIKKQDPDSTVGLAGTQCPWVFGGYDFAKLVPEMEWVEAYSFGQSVDCFRSFKKRRDVPFLKTSGLGGDAPSVAAMLWTYVYQSGGHAGTIIWESNAMVDLEDEALPLNDRARELGTYFAELRGGIPRLLQLSQEKSSPVAVHYSQASINADFITAVPARPAAVAAAEAERFPASQSRNAWWKLLEDRGLRPLFLSDQQIMAGDLIERGFKVLLLPRSISISDEVAAEMKKFVESGGTLIADSFAGRMDQHCREREEGVLDEYFGIKRTENNSYYSFNQRASLDYDAEPDQVPVWGQGPNRAECSLIEESIKALPGTTVMGCSEYSDTQLGIVRQHGSGRTVYFNCAPLEHLQARKGSSAGVAFQKFFGQVFSRAGVQAELAICKAGGAVLSGWQVFPFADGPASYYGLSPDMGVTQDVLGAIDDEGDEVGNAVLVDITFPSSGHIYEMRSGRYLGQGDKAQIKLEPTDAPLFAVMPYKVDSVQLSENDGQVQATINSDADLVQHVFRFEILDASGQPLLDRGANVLVENGKATWMPGENLPGGGKIVVRDVISGICGQITL